MIDIQLYDFIQKAGSFRDFIQSQITQSHHIIAMNAVPLVQVVFPNSQIGQ